MPISLVSVIVPAYNAVVTIGEQLDALSVQSYVGDFEVLVCDNGSTDGLREYVDSHPSCNVLQLKWVDASDVRGVSHVRNVGAEGASGDFLAFCDADDRVHPEWLRWLAKRASTDDFVSCAVETESINTATVHEWRPIIPSESKYAARFLPYAIGAGFGVRRSTYLAVGGCDESMLNGGDDVDLSWRLQLAGTRLAHEPRSVVAYRVRSSLRGVWHQARRFGVGDVELFRGYRSYGLRRLTVSEFWWFVVTLALNNPLVPRRWSKINRGGWVSLVGYTVGNIQGSIRHRVLYF